MHGVSHASYGCLQMNKGMRLCEVSHVLDGCMQDCLRFSLMKNACMIDSLRGIGMGILLT